MHFKDPINILHMKQILDFLNQMKSVGVEEMEYMTCYRLKHPGSFLNFSLKSARTEPTPVSPGDHLAQPSPECFRSGALESSPLPKQLLT